MLHFVFWTLNPDSYPKDHSKVRHQNRNFAQNIGAALVVMALFAEVLL